VSRRRDYGARQSEDQTRRREGYQRSKQRAKREQKQDHDKEDREQLGVVQRPVRLPLLIDEAGCGAGKVKLQAGTGWRQFAADRVNQRGRFGPGAEGRFIERDLRLFSVAVRRRPVVAHLKNTGHGADRRLN